MNRKKRRLPIIIQGIFKRSISNVMGKLVLFEDYRADDVDGSIRHYDMECEAVVQIKNAITSGINRKKAEAFFKLRFQHSRKPSNVSRILSKSQVLESKTTSGSKREIVYKQQRRKTFDRKQMDQQNFSQVSQLLQKIKKFVEKPREKSSNLQNWGNSSFASGGNSRVYNKLMELENEFTQLLKCQQETKTLLRSRMSIGSKNQETPNKMKKSRWEMSTASRTWKKEVNNQENCDSQWTLG